MFDLEKREIALIKKAKPEWQANKWNGIGGKVEIEDITIQHAMDRLNNRPRKLLNYATPNEVFFGDNNNLDSVALKT